MKRSITSKVSSSGLLRSSCNSSILARLSAVELRKESQSTRLSGSAHNTWEPITNLGGYEGMVAASEKVWQENYDKKSRNLYKEGSD